MRIAIIAPSPILPVPAVKGGAIETLITGLIDKNEEKKSLDITVISPYHPIAKWKSKSYMHSHFIWIRYNTLTRGLNLVIRLYAKVTGRRVPHIGVLQILQNVKMGLFDKVVIEGDDKQISAISNAIGIQKTYFHLHARLFSQPEVYRMVNKVMVVSRYIGNQVLMHTGIDSKNVILLQNCAEVSRFKRDSNIHFGKLMRIKYGISDHEIVLCFTGRIVAEKGVKELLETLLMIPQSLPYRLIIAGSAGSSFGMSQGHTIYYDSLLEIASKLSGKVIFTGFLSNDAIPHILAASDISVIPSIYEEPGALTVFESLAAGLPIITTDSGGIPEYVTEECAIVIKRDESLKSNMTLAIMDLIGSEEKRRTMGRAAFLHAQQFSYDKYYSEFIRILSSD